ncbi:hypothetical protein quinque_008413 [Culex quinquefasciatus]
MGKKISYFSCFQCQKKIREKKCNYMTKHMNMELQEAERLQSGNPHQAEIAERLVRLGNQHNKFHAKLDALDKASDPFVITARRDIDRSYYAARIILVKVLEKICNGQTNGRIDQEIEQMSKITNLYLTVPNGKTESEVYGIAGKVVPPGLNFKYERSVKSS